MVKTEVMIGTSVSFLEMYSGLLLHVCTNITWIQIICNITFYSMVLNLSLEYGNTCNSLIYFSCYRCVAVRVRIYSLTVLWMVRSSQISYDKRLSRSLNWPWPSHVKLSNVTNIFSLWLHHVLIPPGTGKGKSNLVSPLG